MSERRVAVIPGHGAGYQPTATAVIDYWFKRLQRIAPEAFTDRVFVDVGCGRGKVLIRWAKLLKRNQLEQRVVGVESDEALLEECERRFRNEKVREGDVQTFLADATDFEYEVIGDKLLFWMFNPFSSYAVDDWCRQMAASVDALVILNNPLHANVLLEEDFLLIDLWDRSSDREDSWFLMWRGASA